MEKRTYELQGRVVDHAGGRGIPAMLVEGWDNDQKFDDLLGSAITDADGRFVLRFDSSAFADAYRDQDPDVYFKIFSEGAPVASTENSIIRNWKNQKEEVTIPITAPRRNDSPDFYNRMSRELKTEMDGLIEHEKVIAGKLRDPAMARLFAEDPLQALDKMDIPVASLLRKRLKDTGGASALFGARSFRLPNGQRITPKVNIHFTERKGAENVR